MVFCCSRSTLNFLVLLRFLWSTVKSFYNLRINIKISFQICFSTHFVAMQFVLLLLCLFCRIAILMVQEKTTANHLHATCVVIIMLETILLWVYLRGRNINYSFFMVYFYPNITLTQITFLSHTFSMTTGLEVLINLYPINKMYSN